MPWNWKRYLRGKFLLAFVLELIPQAIAMPRVVSRNRISGAELESGLFSHDGS